MVTTTGTGTLVVATSRWSRGEALPEDQVRAAREAALLGNHAWYVERIPAYRAYASGMGHGATVSIDDIRRDLVVDERFFKGYDANWLTSDLPRLTAWLDTICAHRLPPADPGWHDATTWREGLKRAGVAVTLSSGTAGTPSLVPRDTETLQMLRVSGGVRLPWAGFAHYDALMLVREGLGRGLQSGATGLAQRAEHVHWLVRGPGPVTSDNQFAAAEFARRAASTGRPLLVYGGPADLDAVLDAIADRPVGLGSDSMVVTGGGWKTATAGPTRTHAALAERAERLLGIPAERCVDTYSTSELNTVLATCSRGRHHVPPCLEVLVLDETYAPVAPGTTGRLAFLDPFARSYPGFVATGDRGRLAADPCPCGLEGDSLVGGVTRLPGATPRGCALPATTP